MTRELNISSEQISRADEPAKEVQTQVVGGVGKVTPDEGVSGVQSNQLTNAAQDVSGMECCLKKDDK